MSIVERRLVANFTVIGVSSQHRQNVR